MHYSRVSIPPSEAYSTASAVLLNELLKGSISFFTALFRVYTSRKKDAALYPPYPHPQQHTPLSALRQVLREIFSPDCWKLSIPALLYVVQNSLQFVAVSNLPVATFQVTYQMKILTTAAFSVALLRKRLSSTKWVSLIFLALGVAIVQIQTTTSTTHTHHRETAVGSAHDSAPLYTHIMSPLKGFGAVTAACFTSGLAGVYFEMVLKNSKADLWVRNVQLSLFSLIPALLPMLYHQHSSPPSPHHSQGFFGQMFANFGVWAWATVSIQVFGGLVTAVVIKYSDNILKGFATSLSIILSFLASVALFDFKLTSSFVIGSSVVLASTWMYNQPAGKEPQLLVNVVNGATGTKPRSSWPGSPVGPDEPILGETGMGMEMDKKIMSRVPTPTPSSTHGSPRIPSLSSSSINLNLSSGAPSPTAEITPFGHHHPQQGLGLGPNTYGQGGGMEGGGTSPGWQEMVDTPRYLSAPYGSPYNSRTPSPAPPSPSASGAGGGFGVPPPPLSRFSSSASGMGSPNLGTGIWMGGGERRQ